MFRANLFEILKSFWYKEKKISEKKKIAILIGNTYEKNIKYTLHSSDNDIIQIKNLLIEKFNYIENNIFILRNSTKKNILNLFKNIIKNINSDDQIFFYFTGHGTENGLVTEDDKILYNFEIRNQFINHLQKDVKMFGLIDSCHSENEFNLPYYYNNYKWSKYIYKKPLCDVIMISACMKNQVTYEKFYDNKYQSFITKIFTNIIYDNINITWYKLLNEINKLIVNNGYNQTAILSSYDIFNLDNLINITL